MGYYGMTPAKYSEGPAEPLVQALRGLPPPECMQTLDLVETTTRKVAQNPKDPKFRKLRLANEKIASALTNVDGAFEIMSELGWEIQTEGEDAFLVLPDTVTLTFPDHVHKILEVKSWYVKQNDNRRRELGLSRIQSSPRDEVKFLPLEGAKPKEGPTPLQVAVENAAKQAKVEKKPSQKSAFSFESRAKKEEAQHKADDSLAALRAEQKAKFSEFKQDPNAYQKPEYQRPSAALKKNDDDAVWYNPTTWFGGGGGGGGGSGGNAGGGSNQRKNIKSMSDLPKPVQRGG